MPGDNAYDWMAYVNETLDRHEHWMVSHIRDIEMANLRLQRLLDATLQRLGESESLLLPESESDTSDIGNAQVGPTASL